ncbi:uncharacterized protein A4U43_C09F14510 [Asparagus officinalis]|uniref:Armadillo repeat-containing domain-containing protein n=1 Tax=Asparagus officinalis TaxID=4686 RepID=A0A5P1E7N0_ASPOF|nr:uncharacterized protein A4U43_C09F14510 [Asparagus officinalis]
MAESSTILNQLARVLESESGFSKENACVALKNLTLVKENAIFISSRGGIASLLEICGSGTPSAVAVAAGVLRNLAGVQELRQSCLEENAVPVLIRVLKSGTVIAQENSMGCLCNLAAGTDDDYSIKIAIFKEGVLDCMMDYMEGDRNSQPCYF